MLDLHKNRLYRLGWILWLIQNLILLIPFITCIPIVSTRLFRYFDSLDLVYYVNITLNYIFTFALILDLVSIAILSIAVYRFFSSEGRKITFRSEGFFISVSGFLWIVCSVLWRFPFYFIWGFDLGFTNRRLMWDLEDNQFYLNLINNHFMHLFQIIGAFCLFFFLFLQERYFEPIIEANRESDVGTMGIGRGTLLGAVNILGMLTLFLGSNISSYTENSMEFYGSRPNGLIFLIGVVCKVGFIPLLSILTCWKMISLAKLLFPLKHEIPARPFIKTPLSVE